MWAWERLKQAPEDFAPFFGIAAAELLRQLANQERLYESATDKPSEIAKNRLRALVENASRSVPELLREIAKMETQKQRGEVKEIADRLQDFIRDWRAEA